MPGRLTRCSPQPPRDLTRDSGTVLVMKALLLVVLTGCVIVTTTKVETISLGRQDNTYRLTDHGVTLTSETMPGAIRVRARRSFDCEHRTSDITQTVKTKHLRLGGVEDPRGKVFGFFLTPITIPVSAVISGLSVASSQTEVARHEKVVSSKRSSCIEAAAALPVLVELPSGETLELRTDAAGESRFTVPEDEPFAGKALVHAGKRSLEIAYVRGGPGMTAIDDAARSCAAKHDVHGPVAVRIFVGPNRNPMNVAFSIPNPAFNGCVANAISQVELPPHDGPLVLRFRMR